MTRAANSWTLHGLPIVTSLALAAAALGCSNAGVDDAPTPAAAGAVDTPVAQPDSDDGDATRQGGGNVIPGRETSGSSGGAGGSPDVGGAGGAGGSGGAEPSPGPGTGGQGGGGGAPPVDGGGTIDCAWLTDCDGTCVNVASDPNACGGCGNVCNPIQGCVDGLCVSCPPAWSWCVETCVNPMADAANCGGCGITCGENQACVAGSCM
jgi:hypothetical protein